MLYYQFRIPDGGERDPSFEGEYALTEQNILSGWAQGL